MLKSVSKNVNNQGELRSDISLVPMTREMCHALYQRFENDPAVFAPEQMFEPFVYSLEKIDAYWKAQDAPDRRVFAIMHGNEMIGEIKLKYIDFEKRECSMGVHLLNDSVKGKGYGTQAEKLVLVYAFEKLGMNAVNADALLGNTRSQHVLEKVGFRYVRSDDTFKYYRCERKA